MRRGIALTVVALFGSPLHAHPVPKSTHDRTIVVNLRPGKTPDEVVVHVKYRLEVDETTVILEDMALFRDKVNFASFKGKPLAYYGEFTRLHAPIFADRLDVR